MRHADARAGATEDDDVRLGVAGQLIDPEAVLCPARSLCGAWLPPQPVKRAPAAARRVPQLPTRPHDAGKP